MYQSLASTFSSTTSEPTFPPSIMPTPTLTMISRSESDSPPTNDTSGKMEYTNIILPAPAKKYCCQICNRLFTRKEHRSRHELSHTKERPFKCDKCPSCFVRRDLLLRHNRTVHGRNPFLVVSMEVIPSYCSNSIEPELKNSTPHRVSSISMLLNDDTEQTKSTDSERGDNNINNNDNNNFKLCTLVSNSNVPPSPPVSPPRSPLASTQDSTTLPHVSTAPKITIPTPTIINDHHNESPNDHIYRLSPASSAVSLLSSKNSPALLHHSNNLISVPPILPPLKPSTTTTSITATKLSHLPSGHSLDDFGSAGSHIVVSAAPDAALDAAAGINANKGGTVPSVATSMSTACHYYYAPPHHHILPQPDFRQTLSLAGGGGGAKRHELPSERYHQQQFDPQQKLNYQYGFPSNGIPSVSDYHPYSPHSCNDYHSPPPYNGVDACGGSF